MMKYKNNKTNSLKSHWAHQMIEKMLSQAFLLEEQRESLPSSCLKEAQEKEKGAYASELTRRRTWPQLFRKGWTLLFNSSQRQRKDPGTRQREMLEKDREAREIYGNSCEMTKEGTGDNKHSQVLRCGTEIRQQATPLKTDLPRDKLFPEEKDLQRLARRDIFTSFEFLGTSPRMTMFATYRRHLRPCAKDLRQPEDVQGCQKNAFIRDRHGLKNQESLPVLAHSACDSLKEGELGQPRSSKRPQKVLSSLRDATEGKNSQMKVQVKGTPSFPGSSTKPLPLSAFSHMIEKGEHQ